MSDLESIVSYRTDADVILFYTDEVTKIREKPIICEVTEGTKT